MVRDKHSLRGGGLFEWFPSLYHPPFLVTYCSPFRVVRRTYRGMMPALSGEVTLVSRAGTVRISPAGKGHLLALLAQLEVVSWSSGSMVAWSAACNSCRWRGSRPGAATRQTGHNAWIAWRDYLCCSIKSPIAVRLGLGMTWRWADLGPQSTPETLARAAVVRFPIQRRSSLCYRRVVAALWTSRVKRRHESFSNAFRTMEMIHASGSTGQTGDGAREAVVCACVRAMP
ncbi:hypothetical protein B0T10DRAFT_480363 [Thelonectria olida]|uniref:Uncharacterized protein n=1 Tax=Thelonectria olida TaxID=1576542 RepID=A0A9P8WCY0_9HYPO|nr:hypothetical protein B0T10DRAFT_480363 [Thelonectria olida]